MRCGVLYDKDGNVKRTWALVSDTAQIGLEELGDKVQEWEVDHGALEADDMIRSQKQDAAQQHQQLLSRTRTRGEVEAARSTYQGIKDKIAQGKRIRQYDATGFDPQP